MSVSARVLVVLMAHLAGSPSRHLWHKDSVVIYQAQLPVFDDDVAML